MGEAVKRDPAEVSARVAVFSVLCDSTSKMLDDFIDEMRLKDKGDIIVAASHLKDSLAVFTRVCHERLLRGDDI